MLNTLAFFLAVVTPAAPRSAADGLFLVADHYGEKPGPVAVSLAGSASTQPVAPPSTRWLFVRSLAVQENRDTLDDFQTSTGRLSFDLQPNGPLVVGLDFVPVVLGKSKAYRSAMLLCRRPGQSAGAELVTTECSLSAWIRPVFDPTAALVPGELSFQVGTLHEEAERASIDIFDADHESHILRKADRHGVFRFDAKPGTEYRILATVVEAEASETFAATLCFRTAQAGGL